MTYKLVSLDSEGNDKVLGRGERAQVKLNLDNIRKNGLPGFRYIMVRDKGGN